MLWISRFLARLGKESGEIAYPLLAGSVALVLLVRRPMQAHQADAQEPWTLRGAVSGFTVLARHPILRPMISWIVGFNVPIRKTIAI